MKRNIILEYIWLDGHSPQNLRSKVKVIKREYYITSTSGVPLNIPAWNFDGSSTQQAKGSASEMLLKPVRRYEWNEGHYLILCEVHNPDGTPAESNKRSALSALHTDTKDAGFWWGYEQEYYITSTSGVPLGFTSADGILKAPLRPQGEYYCGVGGGQVKGRRLVDRHMMKCLEMGINITGTNAEVAIGQWEYQCFAKDSLKAADDLWISRYALKRLAEEYNYDIDFSPKPVKGDWNGSGCHTNFSNSIMRGESLSIEGSEGYFRLLLDAMQQNHSLHIAEYGKDNKQRLTGEHETQHINKFSWGVGDRGASIRVPTDTAKNWVGYLEDRRPAANCNPYRVAKRIIETVENNGSQLS